MKSNSWKIGFSTCLLKIFQNSVRGFFEFDARVWDQQIEADLKAGKLDGLIAEALAEYKAGKAREL